MSIRSAIVKTLKAVQQVPKINNKMSSMEKVQRQIKVNSEDINKKFDFLVENSQINTDVKFSIVTAVYNNADYIDDYFLSIVKQKEFKNIQVIVVDDGSTDGTAGIVKKWEESFPDNVQYYYQENSGQSQARNNGLKYVTGEWVTFIDMDDFISDNYFSEANLAINIHGNKASMYINKWVNYLENIDTKVNKHPLNWRFKDIPRFKEYNLENRPDAFYLSASSSFFNAELIKRYSLKFKDIKPNFEDANFITTYIQTIKNTNLIYIRDTEYFYRKRSDKSSTIDTAVKDKRKYLDLLRDGYLGTLKQFEGEVPTFVQKEILYDLRWNFDSFSDNRHLLTDEEVKERDQLLKSIFAYINIDVVEKANDVTSAQFLKLIEKEYYGISQIPTVTYIQRDLNTITLKFEGIEEELHEISVNGEKVINSKVAIKNIITSISQNYIEYFIKMNMISNQLPVLDYHGTVLEIQKVNEKYKSAKFSKKSKILFFDRADKADDNAEVLYEWFVKNKPEFKNIYFGIRDDVTDWERLKNKGFNLVAYGKEDFDNIYEKADYIFSSAGDDSIHNYKRFRYFWYKSNAKFIFLQHGIITDDLSQWLWGKRINQMVVSSSYEVDTVKPPKYSIFDNELIHSGLPRFDKLYSDNKDKLLLLLTWRKEFENLTISQFAKTEYAKRVVQILESASMNDTLIKNNLTLSVVLHPSINKFLSVFNKYVVNNKNIQIIDSRDASYRDLFAESNMMITDYSSTALDFAYLDKPVTYYQWDSELFFANHTYDKGLDYETDGFGDVVYEFPELLTSINNTIESGFRVKEEYTRRKDDFFLYNDKENCERLFTAMKNIYGE